MKKGDKLLSFIFWWICYGFKFLLSLIFLLHSTSLFLPALRLHVGSIVLLSHTPTHTLTFFSFLDKRSFFTFISFYDSIWQFFSHNISQHAEWWWIAKTPITFKHSAQGCFCLESNPPETAEEKTPTNECNPSIHFHTVENLQVQR